MSKVFYRCLSITYFVFTFNFVVTQAQQTQSDTTEIDVLESMICEAPKRCIRHYQCTEQGTLNIRGVLILNPRFDDENSDTLRVGAEVYKVPPNNTINLRSGGEAMICHYLDRCCGNESTPATPKTSQTPTPIEENRFENQEKGCGYRNPEGIYFKIKTTNYDQAQYGEFPWIIAVLWRHPDKPSNKLVGGGSLIHPNVVLTAAHIVFGKSPSDFNVRAGEWDTQTDLENLPYQERTVNKILIHDKFYVPVVLYDAALLIVNKPFELIESIQPICLPPNHLIFENDQNCFAAGWGKDKFSSQGRRQSILKKVRLPMIPFNTCQELLRRTRLGDFYELHESFVCAGGMKDQDTCTGDGGAPLVCAVGSTKNRYFQTGIVAWGIGCGEDNVPGVYVNVPQVRDWIDKNMLEEGFGTESYTIK